MQRIRLCTYQNYAKKKCSEKAINEIAEDFAKIVAVTKLKELKGYAKNILPKYKEWKTKNHKLYR